MGDTRILLDLLETPSPSGEEEAACAVFADHAVRLGFKVERDAAGNAIVSMGHGTPHTMFLGHIDTVPGWWPVQRGRGTVHARGAVDAKGALVAALVAAYRVGPETPGTRVVVAAVGEEADSRGAFQLLRRPPPDFLVVGEPSEWDRVAIGFRGQRLGTLRTETTRAHGSSPMPSSLDLAVDAAARLRAHVASLRRKTAFDSPSCRLVDWRHIADVEREVTEFRVDVRSPRDFDWEGLGTIAPEVRWSKPVEAVLVDKGNAVARALVAGIRAAGGVPEYVLKGGTSDMNHAARVWRIPMASYGPGNPKLDHGPEERLSLEEFTRSIEVLRHAFTRLALRPLATRPVPERMPRQ